MNLPPEDLEQSRNNKHEADSHSFSAPIAIPFGLEPLANEDAQAAAKPCSRSQPDPVPGDVMGKTPGMKQRPLATALLAPRRVFAVVVGASLAGAAYLWLAFSSAASPLAPQNVAESLVPPSHLAVPTGSAGPVVTLNQAQIFTPEAQSTAAVAKPATSPTMDSARRKPAQTHAPKPNSDPPIRIWQTPTEPDTNLLRGHAHLQRKEFQLARHEFEQTLLRDPDNTDALLALAAIAQLLGNTPNAQALYQRAVTANPLDPAVQAAALNGNEAQTSLSATESRLKTLLATRPESGPLNFSLGNVYTRQQRWPEAQQHYFNAVAADGDNPDYLFNLAVSLDHLGQSRLAAQHYRQALEAAERRPAAFVRAQADQRLRELPSEQRP